MTSLQRATPSPAWIVRHHAPSPIHSLAFANRGQDLISGDARGRVSITSMSTYRPHIFFQPHKEAILRADVWSGYLLTICVWSMPTERSTALLGSGALSDLPAPSLMMELPVNSLNYCGFAMVTQASDAHDLKAYMVVPHTLESAWLDVYELPTKRRVVEALGRSQGIASGAHRPAIVMALQARIHENCLEIVSGMEDGHVTAWSLPLDTWEAQQLWSFKPHIETVLALGLAPSQDYVVSVGADRSMVQIGFKKDSKPATYTAPRPGQACVALRDDDKMMAVGGWDGTTRLYKRPTMELWTSLRYHRESVQALAFPRHDQVHTIDTLDETSSYEEEDEDETNRVSCPLPPWLACGSKDGRISLWKLPLMQDHEQ